MYITGTSLKYRLTFSAVVARDMGSIASINSAGEWQESGGKRQLDRGRGPVDADGP